jgi:iron uptake system EfeUOB component EfeO/EfeM
VSHNDLVTLLANFPGSLEFQMIDDGLQPELEMQKLTEQIQTVAEKVQFLKYSSSAEWHGWE